MTGVQAEWAEYHQSRRDEERRRAANAVDERVRQSHSRLAALHDLQLLDVHLAN